jgi:hypothetical protein
MNTQLDFEELLRLLEEKHVEYLVVGDYAVAFHKRSTHRAPAKVDAEELTNGCMHPSICLTGPHERSLHRA